MRREVARALASKGWFLMQQDKNAEAMYNFDELIRRYGEDDSPAVHESVAKALVNKAAILMGQDKNVEGMTLLDEIVRRYREDSLPGTREVVAGIRA